MGGACPAAPARLPGPDRDPAYPWHELAADRLALARVALDDGGAPAARLRVALRALAAVLADPDAPPAVSRLALGALADAGAWLGLT